MAVTYLRTVPKRQRRLNSFTRLDDTLPACEDRQPFVVRGAFSDHAARHQSGERSTTMPTWTARTVHMLWLLAVPCSILLPTGQAGEPVILAAGGRSRMPVTVAGSADRQRQELAKILAAHLGRLSGAVFRVTSRTAGPGIVLQLDRSLARDKFDHERYTIRTGRSGVDIAGATPLALEHAVWDLLHRLGYRQYFPGRHWEIVPRSDVLKLDLDLAESPAFHSRRMAYGFGLSDDNREAWWDWCRKNRLGGSVELKTGHAYGKIIAARQAEFDRHPEFYALIDGQRRVEPNAKFCVSNQELRATVINYALEFFQQHPERDCLSLEPSDGGGWCECAACQAVGTPSDRVVLLANDVAAACEESEAARGDRQKFVAVYAYNLHSPPPGIPVHPRVIVSVATAFIRGGWEVDDLVTAWSRQSPTLGIREYYSLSSWSRGLPGAARAANSQYLATTIPRFYDQNARFLMAEVSGDWGANGLGYYLAARTLWDVKSAEQHAELLPEFTANCFGPARGAMLEFYRRLDGVHPTAQLVMEDLLAHMFRQLAVARRQIVTSAQRQRIDDLILYTRYVELYHEYRYAKVSRQQRFEQLLRYVYRIRETMMVDAQALFESLPRRDRRVKLPPQAAWNVPIPKNPWKSRERITDAEIEQILRQGVSRHVRSEIPLQARAYHSSLVPSTPLSLPAVRSGHAESARGPRSYYTYLDEPGNIVLQVTGGLIAHYRNRGNVRIALWRLGTPGRQDAQLVTRHDNVPPDGEERSVTLPCQEPGVYRIDVNDGMDATRVTWPPGQWMTWKMSVADRPPAMQGAWTLYFFVPRETARIEIYARTRNGSVVAPDGSIARSLRDVNGECLAVEVPSGLAGSAWLLQDVEGEIRLINVPPYLARRTDELLLPAEVVAADE